MKFLGFVFVAASLYWAHTINLFGFKNGVVAASLWWSTLSSETQAIMVGATLCALVIIFLALVLKSGLSVQSAFPKGKR